MKKKISRYFEPTFLFVLFVFFISIFLLKNYTLFFSNAFRLNWIFLLISLIFIITPLSSIKIHSEHLKSYSIVKYIGLIVCFQASLYAISLGFARLSGQLFPIFTFYHPSVVSDTMQFVFQDSRLFPWGFCLLWIAAFCGFSFCFNAKRHPKIKYFLFYISRLMKMSINIAVACGLGIVSACLLLQLCYLLLSIKPLMIAYGPSWITVITFLITLLIMTRKRVKRLLSYLNHHLSPAFVWFIFIACCVLLLVEINTLIMGSIHQPFLVPRSLIKWQLSTPWIILWKITIASWWILVIPMTTMFIIRFSNGYSLRTILLSTLAFPFLLSIALNANLKWHFFPSALFSSSANILTLIGCIVFLYFMMNSRSWMRTLFLGRFPKHGRVKNENHWIFFMKIRLSFFSILYLMLIYGIPLLIIPIFASAFLFILVLIVLITLFFYVSIIDYFKID